MTYSAFPHQRTRRPGAVDSRAVIAYPTAVSGLWGWWRAHDLGLNDNNAVNSWAAVSGYGPTLTAVTGAAPVFRANQVNGYPAVEFIANDSLDGMTASLAMATYFVVLSRRTVTNNVILLQSDSSFAYAFLQYGDSWYTAGNHATTVPMAGSTWMLKGCRYTGTMHQRFTNGTNHAGSNSTSGALLRYLGAGGYTAEIVVAELIIYSQAVSDVDRDTLRAYFRSKYALW